MEILELLSHPYYVAVQFHPEYLSRPMDPSPPFMGLILAAKDRLNSYFARGKLSPREPQSDYYDSDKEEN
jgi:CTP synthase